MNNKFLSGLLIGALAGAALAIFLSSEKGQEMVEDLKDAAGDAAGNAKEQIADLHDELNSLLKKGKAFAEDLEQKIKQATA